MVSQSGIQGELLVMVMVMAAWQAHVHQPRPAVAAAGDGWRLAPQAESFPSACTEVRNVSGQWKLTEGRRQMRWRERVWRAGKGEGCRRLSSIT